MKSTESVQELLEIRAEFPRLEAKPSSPSISDDELVALADEVFVRYDEEESET